jgi:GH15 family glucan-1,4-alpha-glucosidase
VGTKEAECKEGTWRDAEDGVLSGNPVVQGSVDSALAVHLPLQPRGQAGAWYWIAVGEDSKEVTHITDMVRFRGPSTFLTRTDYYWMLWAAKEKDQEHFGLPHEIEHLFRRSLLILRTQIDNGGAFIAANDFDIAHFGRDTYSYMWPRDGALVAVALIEAGYSELSRRFFSFCQRVITEEGYLLHKYNPDGSLGSSWHGWYRDGGQELPIQADETALVL